MSGPAETTSAVPAQAVPPAGGPWADYLAAAQRLDAVRRAAGAAAGEREATVQAAAQELATIRARLAPQRARLAQDLGVPEGELTPRPDERELAARSMAGGPAAVLSVLRQTRGTADAADAAMLREPSGRARWRPWARNMLVYGPFAAAVLVVQIVLYLVAPSGSVPTYALLCGLSLPVLAFAMGWVTIGFVYGGGGVKVDRTPIIGAIACLTPVLLTCMGVGVLTYFR